MDLSPCTYENLSNEGLALVAQAQAWKPAPGHASYCNTQRAPWLRDTLTTVRGAKKAPAACSCSKNVLAKRLRKLADLHTQGRC